MPGAREVRQAETAECGLAALTVVAQQLGHHIDLTWARQRFPRHERGPGLATLLGQARSLGLEARALRAGVDDLRRLRRPAILHWDFRHFVVLVGVARRGCHILDPASGRRRVSWRDVSAHFTGVAVEFARGPDFTAIRGGRRPLCLADLLMAYRGLGRYLGLMLLLLLANQLLGLALPIGSQLLIDETVRGQDSRWLNGVIAGLGAIMAAGLAVDVLRQQYGLVAGIRVSIDTATAMVRHVLSLPAATIEKRTTADTLSRIDSLQPVQRALTDTLLALVVQGMSFVVTGALMLYYSPLLAGLCFLFMLLACLLHAALLPRTREHNLDQVVAQAEARQSLLESLAGAASMQAYGLQHRLGDRWRRAWVRAGNARAAQGRLTIAAGAGQAVLAAVDQLAFLAVGLDAIAGQRLTLGALFALLTLRGRLAAAFAATLTASRDLFLLGTHLDRVGDLVAEALPAAAPASARRAQPTGQLGCSGLTYAWQEGVAVIRDFCCEVDAGERVVFCGPSGAGKSTLIRLLACELTPGGGSLRYDDWDVALWDRDRLRSHFGVVRQSDRLFSGSIAENISAFDPHPDPGRIRRAAELAAIWTDLLALPMRLETPLVDGGSGLSGGQLQRLLLARALYREPRVLFLDEATNQLDERTERRVLGNLAALRVTILYVAHGPQAIRLGGRPIRLGYVANGKSSPALS